MKTSKNPSTPTIGHKKCGYVFNFIDDKIHKRYSSRKELKSLAMRFAQKNNLDNGAIDRFLVKVGRLKSNGNLSDEDILVTAFQTIKNREAGR